MNEGDALNELQTALRSMLSAQIPPLQIRKDEGDIFEVVGTKRARQGRKEVDGFYFGSVIPKPGDIRLYFFPIYTHAKKYDWISSEMRKCLKGKSCFHFKELSASLKKEMEKMIKLGIELYKKEDWI